MMCRARVDGCFSTLSGVYVFARSVFWPKPAGRRQGTECANVAVAGAQLAVRWSPANQRKQCPQKPRNREKPQRGGRALLRPKTDRNPDQKPNQTDRPTDRTQYRTRAGSRHQTAPLNSHVCVGPFFRVTQRRRAQGSNMSTLAARAIIKS